VTTDLRPRVGGLVFAALACVATAIGVQYVRDRVTPPADERETFLYVPSGTALKRMALGYDALLADVYWIRAVQYFGGQTLAARAELKHDLLYPLLDITTTLDPYFNIAYRFGSVFVAEGAPRPGRPDLAVQLLEKGSRVMPDRWQYPYDIAFIHYWWLRDYKGASAWFTKASRIPGSPEWMPGLAGVTLIKGGDRAGARFLWRQIYESAEQEYMRRTASHRLVQLDILDELDRLNAALDRVAAESGTRPTSWEPLARRGWLRRVPPTDPSGSAYVIVPETGHATINRMSRYYPLPDDAPPGEPSAVRGPGTTR
jgi:hypothetical protein